MSKIKQFIVNGYHVVKFFALIAIMGICFYTGMFVVSHQQNPEEAGSIMIAKVDQALQSSEYQPIIMIVPELTLIEQAKLKIGMELPEREIVTITTSTATKVLGIKVEEKPGLMTTAIVRSKAAYVSTTGFFSEKSVAGWNWVSERMPFGD